ncbi:hypothetical protein Ahy_A09g041755 isoform C [Arachis hypogaea]|uniref:Uncharacterized protein n=1 Tax=Arachis hypogaea TaxID=3818 RepID=A0A445BDN8_ARAHY|nr:hypothetical protein Ahy_A09g041755 isoform C [Arachis hypogaea]
MGCFCLQHKTCSKIESSRKESEIFGDKAESVTL